jgi:hypothetical protein
LFVSVTLEPGLYPYRGFAVVFQVALITKQSSREPFKTSDAFFLQLSNIRKEIETFAFRYVTGLRLRTRLITVSLIRGASPRNKRNVNVVTIVASPEGSEIPCWLTIGSGGWLGTLWICGGLVLGRSFYRQGTSGDSEFAASFREVRRTASKQKSVSCLASKTRRRNLYAIPPPKTRSS